ncbi:MAG: hypothetical protein ABFD66_09190 [Smithella sp.]
MSKSIFRSGWLIVFVLLSTVASFALMRLYEWAAFLFGVCALTGLAEWLCVRDNGKTLSQRFWAFRKKNPVSALVLVVILVGALVVVGLHLLS